MALLRALRDGLLYLERQAARVYIAGLVIRAVRRYIREGGTTAAAAVSYYVLFSAFPLLIFMVAAVSLFARDQSIERDIVSLIMNQLPEDTGLQVIVEGVVSAAVTTDLSLVSVIALGGMLWAASGMFAQLRRSLNRAFGVAEARPYVLTKAVDLLSVFGVMALVMVSIAASTALGLARERVDQWVHGTAPTLAWNVAYFVVPLILSFLTFLLMYLAIPDSRARVGDLWPGALLSAIGFELVKIGFGMYVMNFGRYQQIYGALSGVIVFLLFVYVVATMMIFAASLSGELLRDRRAKLRPPVPDTLLRSLLAADERRQRTAHGGQPRMRRHDDGATEE